MQWRMFDMLNNVKASWKTCQKLKQEYPSDKKEKN